MISKNDTKVSIIVPVFNAGDYLAACIDNLKKQSFQNYEVLIVDDGSTDDSFKKAVDTLEHDDRFKVFHKCNGGVSSARNYGLDRAAGEFVMFLDVDDTLDNNTLELLLDKVADGVDWVSAGYRGVAGGNLIYENKVASHVVIHGWKELATKFDELHKTGKFNSPVSRLFRRNIIGDLRFDESVALGEDLLFNFEYMKRCDGEMLFLPIALYNYNEQNAGSATKRYRKTDLDQLLLLYKRTGEIKESLGLENYHGDCSAEVLCLGVITTLQTLFYSNKKYQEKRCEVKRFFANNTIVESFSANYQWGINNKITKFVCKLNNCMIMALFFFIKKSISRFM